MFYLIPVRFCVILIIYWRLKEVDKEELLGKIKVTVAGSFPDEESFHWRDCNIVQKQMDDFHLNTQIYKLT